MSHVELKCSVCGNRPDSLWYCQIWSEMKDKPRDTTLWMNNETFTGYHRERNCNIRAIREVYATHKDCDGLCSTRHYCPMYIMYIDNAVTFYYYGCDYELIPGCNAINRFYVKCDPYSKNKIPPKVYFPAGRYGSDGVNFMFCKECCDERKEDLDLGLGITAHRTYRANKTLKQLLQPFEHKLNILVYVFEAIEFLLPHKRGK